MRRHPFLPLLVALLCLTYFAVPTFARRAVSFANGVQEFDTAENDASYTTTATQSMTTAQVGICAVGNTDATGTGADTTPTLTQSGYTWTRVDGPTGFVTVASPDAAITLFRAVGTGAAAAVLTADFGADAQTSIGVYCFIASGVDTGGTNGANAIVQFDANSTDGADPFTFSLPSAVAGNGTVVIAGCNSSTTWSVDTSPDTYTAGSEINYSAPVHEWWGQTLGQGDDAPSIDFAASEACAGYAVEMAVAAAAVGTGSNMLLLRIGSPR